MSDEEKEAIEQAVNEQIEWLEENQEADAEDYAEHKKALEEVVTPIVSKLYEGAGGAPPPEGEEYEGYDERDEL